MLPDGDIPLTDRDAREATAGPVEYPATITDIRRTDTPRSADRFDTEIMVDVDDNGFVAPGNGPRVPHPSAHRVTVTRHDDSRQAGAESERPVRAGTR